jgi:hypothetical protein
MSIHLSQVGRECVSSNAHKARLAYIAPVVTSAEGAPRMGERQWSLEQELPVRPSAFEEQRE